MREIYIVSVGDLFRWNCFIGIIEKYKKILEVCLVCVLYNSNLGEKVVF